MLRLIEQHKAELERHGRMVKTFDVRFVGEKNKRQ
jgi:hypothetical protein